MYSQNIGISKIRKAIGEPGEILGQKILNQKMLTTMILSFLSG